MPTDLHWIASASASALHAANAYVEGRNLTDVRLRDTIVSPAAALHAEIMNSSLPVIRYWKQLLAWSHHMEHNRELARTAIRKVCSWQAQYESLAGRLGELISSVESTVQRAVPGIVDELTNRSRPIREQWEARGPGLLKGIGLLTDERLLVENAEVVLVLPVLGGGGAAQLLNNSVRLEAVLTNNIPQLPEVVRLAWLLAQLNCDLPNFSESISAERLAFISQLALLPPSIQSAQEVELATLTPETVLLATRQWQFDEPVPDDVADVLFAWWQTYGETRPDWKTALGALDRMVRVKQFDGTNATDGTNGT